MKKAILFLLCLALLAGHGFASAEPGLTGLLEDLVAVYEDPSPAAIERLDAETAALCDPVASAVEEHWKRVFLDPDYALLLYGTDEPAQLPIPDPAAHAFVVLGFELQNGEMADELKGRCEAAAAAARAFPGSVLVCSGGATGRNNPEGHTEAGLMKEYLTSVCGVEPDRVFIDERARNTAENAVNTFAILRERGVKTMTIVTSSYHQRRAQVLYNALAAVFARDEGYAPVIVGNFCYDIPASGISAAVSDARLAVQQLAGLLGASGEPSGEPSTS